MLSPTQINLRDYWRRRGKPSYLDQPVEPSKWDLMLAKRGLTEADVLAKPTLVRAWVAKHGYKYFVPEEVLWVLGLNFNIHYYKE